MKEHDRDRITAAMEGAKRLRLAEKLSRPMELAARELEKLNGGLGLERALIAELAKGGSKGAGGGKWAHGGIDAAGVEAALGAAEAYPLISKQGVALVRQGHVAVKVRAALKADDWKALAALLGGITDDAESACADVRNARQELDDVFDEKV